jgi:hypothetical protein
MQVRAVLLFTIEQTGQDPSGTEDCAAVEFFVSFLRVIEELASGSSFLSGLSSSAKLGDWRV